MNKLIEMVINAAVSAAVAAAIVFSFGGDHSGGLGAASRAPDVDLSVKSLTTSGSLTATGTTTLTQSVDGLMIGGTMSTAATGTARTLYTNTTGPKVCDSSTGFLYVKNNGSFAPSVKFSFATSTGSVPGTNLLASTTIATTTTAVVQAIDNTLFVLPDGASIIGIMADYNTTGASSTYFGNLSAEFSVWCQDVSI